MSGRPDPPYSAVTLLVQASRVSPHLRAAVAEVEAYVNAQQTAYDEATDCMICAQLATDRDDAITDADLQRESYMAADARERRAHTQLADLARLSLRGSRRDVELYVHRLAYNYRDTALGTILATLDEVPGVSLRAAGESDDRSDDDDDGQPCRRR